MPDESIQHKLDRVRPPRVQITYDVEIGDAIQKKELPFVGGVMASLSGSNAANQPKLKERKFVEIDRDNFNAVLKSSQPMVNYTATANIKITDTVVDETGASEEVVLKEEEQKIKVEDLAFNELDDFEPTAVVKRIDALNDLLTARTALNDLIAKLDGNDDLDALLQGVINNNEDKEALIASLAELLPKEEPEPAE